MKRLHLYVLAATVLLTACAGPAPSPAGPGAAAKPPAGSPAASAGGTASHLESIRTTGKLVLATALFEPFEQYEPGSGKLVGFDVDVAEQIARDLGVRIEWREYQFAGLLAAVQSGQVDAAIGAIYITDARRQQVDFSGGYVTTGEVAVVRSGSDIRQIPADLSQKSVAVKLGSTSAKRAERWRSDGIALTIVTYGSTQEQMQALADGAVDVALNDELNTLAFMKAHPNLLIVGAPLSSSELGIAVRKGDAEVLRQVNSSITRMKMDGTVDQLLRKWFR